MDFNEIIEGLSESEKKVLPTIKKDTKVQDIVKKTSLQEIVVMRCLQWLSNKDLVVLEKKEMNQIILGDNGKKYEKEGLPEHLFLKELTKKDELSMSDLSRKISVEEINACTGILRRKEYISINKKDQLYYSITKKGEEKLKEGFEEEKLLKKLPLEENELNKEEQEIIKELIRRKDIIIKDKKSEWSATITEEGKKISESDKLKQRYEERITPAMIKSGKEYSFKKYDVNSDVPKISTGRKHYVNEAIKYIKSIWLELGFEEMEGREVQPAFWNLDALFVPQDHPAREMQDTFYLEGKEEIEKEIFQKVKDVHENGGDTGSKGWGGEFSKEVSQELMLRTHTTVLSAIKFSELKIEDLPKKYFVVGKVFRNEALDWKHLFEFHQVEGIVIDPNGNMPKLKGYLKQFFKKMGFSDIRIRPAHFPYTEPSAEVEAYNPTKKQWIEMGGAGIMRPEVSQTLLGFECPILAWGLGMERIISKYYNITDIREIYKNDIETLKKTKMFIK
jgi:phenylalanyl-tRNA synthetase alpha chain